MRAARRLLLLPALALLLAAHSSVPMELPERVALPQFTETQKLSDAIITALTNKKWLVDKDTGESITAHLDVRRHALRVRIDYTPREISFHYVDSEELGYEVEHDTPVIHPKANAWLKALGDEVRLQVQPFAFARDPANVVPVVAPEDSGSAAATPSATSPAAAASPPASPDAAPPASGAAPAGTAPAATAQGGNG